MSARVTGAILTVATALLVSTPAHAAESAPPIENEELVLYPETPRFFLEGNLGPGIRGLGGSAVGGAAGEVGLGADTNYGSAGFGFRLFGGQTEGGLGIGDFSAGPTVQWPVGPVRLGAKAGLGYLWISRVTGDEAFDVGTVAVSLTASIDAWRHRQSVVSIGIEPMIESFWTVELFDDPEPPDVVHFSGGATLYVELRYMPGG